MKKGLYAFILLPVMALLLSGSATPGKVKPGAERNFEFTYIVNVNDIPAGAKNLRMWVPYPASDADQNILDTKITSPYPVEVHYDPEWGNKMMVIDVKNPKAFTFTAVYKVRRHERKFKKSYRKASVTKNESGQYSRYLRPSKMAIMNETVKKMAASATRGKTGPLEKASAIYKYILSNMSYDKTIPGWGKGDVQRVCLTINGGKSGTGNCTDFHSLFASMMREEGIPVKFEMGYPLVPGKNQIEPKAGGYHCWAKFFISGIGWIPVDISEASKDRSKEKYYYGSICENRIRFSTGRDIRLVPAQKGEPLNYFGPDPYIEIDGKKFAGFVRKIAYQNN